MIMKKTEAENRGIDKELFNMLRTAAETQACHQTMGLKVMYLGPGVAGMKKGPDMKFSTKGGRVHGGVIATLADTVMGVAVATSGQFYRTLEISVNYVAAAYEDSELTAEGFVLHMGKTIALVECSIFDKDRRLLAKGKGTYIRDKRELSSLV